MKIDRVEIVRLTEEYGGVWGINHTRRLLGLVEAIGADQEYDRDVVWLAAHLHDWGAYAHWMQDGVDHAVRSGQVAETFLTEKGCPQELKNRVVECIALHHTAEHPGRSCESVLLFDADVLDFLGVVGVLRDFSKNPRNMRQAYEIVRKRREKLPAQIHLESARTLAAGRLRQMDELLARFEQDSGGCF